MRITQEILWKQNCPHCKRGLGKLVKVGRVKTDGDKKSVEVVCGDCGNHLRIHFRVA